MVKRKTALKHNIRKSSVAGNVIIEGDYEPGYGQQFYGSVVRVEDRKFEAKTCGHDSLGVFKTRREAADAVYTYGIENLTPEALKKVFLDRTVSGRHLEFLRRTSTSVVASVRMDGEKVTTSWERNSDGGWRSMYGEPDRLIEINPGMRLESFSAEENAFIKDHIAHVQQALRGAGILKPYEADGFTKLGLDRLARMAETAGTALTAEEVDRKVQDWAIQFSHHREQAALTYASSIARQASYEVIAKRQAEGHLNVPEGVIRMIRQFMAAEENASPTFAQSVSEPRVQQHEEVYISVSGTATDPDDHEVEGNYLVKVQAGLSEPEMAKAALDAFHNKIGISNLDDFEISTHLADGTLIYESDDLQSVPEGVFEGYVETLPFTVEGSAPRL